MTRVGGLGVWLTTMIAWCALPLHAAAFAIEARTDQLIVRLKGPQHAVMDGPERAAIADRLSTLAGERLVPHRAMSGGSQVFKLSRAVNIGEIGRIAKRLEIDSQVFAVHADRVFQLA